MKNIQDLICYLSADAYKLVIWESYTKEGLWCAAIRSDSDAEAIAMQVADSIPLALEALELQCKDMLDRIAHYDDLRIQEDMEIWC